MSTQREKTSSFTLLSPKRGIPFDSSCDNRRKSRKRLTVIDHGRATIETNDCREGRFETWVATTAFERFHERTLLAADIGSRTAMDDDIQVIAAIQDVLTDQTTVICFLHSSFDLTSCLSH